MAQSFLATHGIDLDAELARIQAPTSQATRVPNTIHVSNVTLPGTTHASDISINSFEITSIQHHNPSPRPEDNALQSGSSALIAPSLCHPHIHLDKPYLLSHPRFAASQVIQE